MRNLLFLGMLVAAAFMAGWFQISKEGDRTTIEIDRNEIRSDARRAIDRGRQFLDERDLRFADQPELHGKDAVKELLVSRFARQKGYQLNKRLRMLAGNMIGNYWDGAWEDAFTGKAMVGRGTEFWTLRDGKITTWEAAFNVWERDAPPRPPCA